MMEIILKGEPKEIAALLLEIKARPEEALISGLEKALKEEAIKYQSLAGRVQPEGLCDIFPKGL